MPSKNARTRRARSIVMFCFAISFMLAGCENTPDTQISRDLEQARVTCPTAGLDAVLIRADAGGAAGGWEYYVYIVGKGSPITTSDRPVFEAGDLTGGTLLWSHPHLLDIHYNVADIEQFTNYWDSSKLRADRAESDNDFKVEIRLVPSSSDYSLLGPNGAFKPMQ
jgi:hypothetical protein